MNTFLIFGRKEYQQPLEYLGAITVESGPDELSRIARERFGEGWLEMVAAPESSVVRVIPME
ncbi:MAG: hypothetical protein FJ030_10425 [Chloroflexi bacterium]|nr:hypothetical protein [Chloroflexota bacterium]